MYLFGIKSLKIRWLYIRRKTMKKPELLAPAGSLTKLKYAIEYGADAVYIGGEAFSLRVAAKNFSLEEEPLSSLKLFCFI